MEEDLFAQMDQISKEESKRESTRAGRAMLRSGRAMEEASKAGKEQEEKKFDFESIMQESTLQKENDQDEANAMLNSGRRGRRTNRPPPVNLNKGQGQSSTIATTGSQAKEPTLGSNKPENDVGDQSMDFGFLLGQTQEDTNHGQTYT